MTTQTFDLFQNTPYLDHWRSLSVKMKVMIAILITWVPMVLLAVLENRALGPTQSESILVDAAISIRFLLALPLFLITPNFTGKKLKLVVHHFLDGKIIRPSEKHKFLDLIQTSIQRRDSPVIISLIWIFIYAVTFYLYFKVVPDLPPSWRTIDDIHGRSLSLSGRWFLFVAQPLYYFNVLYFLFRGLLWWRFMFRVSSMNLLLRAAHGDQAGGLGFLGESIKAFILPVLALSTSLAAGASNLVLYENLSLDALKTSFIGISIFLLIFFIGPLMLFVPVLFKTKENGIYKYGTLGGNQLQAFERRWLGREITAEDNVLIAQDFSSVTDASSIITLVNKMKVIPFDIKDLIAFVLAIFIPFLPVAALKVPWNVLANQFMKFIF